MNLTEVKNGILCLTFDDRNFDGWRSAMPLFERYEAHASFFVSGEIDRTALETMKILREAGHTVGLHTQNHADATSYIDQHGAQAYIENEVMPQLKICREAGLEIHSFAYPNNRRSDSTDAVLSELFDHFRAGMKDVADERIFRPVESLTSGQVMHGYGIGEYYSTVESETLARIERAAKENACLTFFSHNIAPNAPHINMPTELLEKMLEKATALGCKILGFDEL